MRIFYSGEARSFPSSAAVACRRGVLSPLALVLVAVGLWAPCTARADSGAGLQEFFATAMEERLRLNPMAAEELGDRSVNDRWPDESSAAQDERITLLTRQLRGLRAFDRAALAEKDQLSYDLFEITSLRAIEGDQWRHHHYVNHQMFGWHTAIPTHLMTVHRVETVADAEAYITRLEKIDTLLGQVVEQMQQQSELGVQPPAFVYPKVIEASENVLKGAPFEEGDDSVLLADFRSKVEGLKLPPAEESGLMARAEAALLGGVLPGYQRLIAEFRREQLQATTDDGVWKLPSGEAYYAAQLRRITTTDLTPEEIHQLGLAQVARIHDEMRAIMREVGFDGSLHSFFGNLKTNQQFYMAETDAGREAYLGRARDITRAMEAKVPEYFALVPRAPMEVRRVEPYRENSAGKAFYQSPSLDGSRPGIFYANLRQLKEMPVYELEALVYHEGIPGHHFQISLAQELEGVPLFQRTASFTAFVEGWGLYAEELGKDMGFYQDPYSDFGRLAMELWRACRLVVDTGIHQERWTREEAIGYLLENTPAGEDAATAAIERYIVMPGQATAYMIGKLKIMELRERARAKLGDRFDWRGFHRVLLGSGAVPLEVLERNLDAWVAGQQRSG